MNKVSKLGLYGLSAGLAVFLGGCAGEKIMVDYVMPARAVPDISKVNVASIRVNAKVTGNLAGDNARNAGLVKQLLAMRLYKEGFYQIADDIWSNPEVAGKLGGEMQAKDAGHGYAAFSAGGQGKEKVVIDLDLELALDAKPVKKEVAYELKTVKYKMEPVKPGEVPTSKPDEKASKAESVKQQIDVYEIVAKGTLKARFSGRDGGAAPVAYANQFAIAMPEADRFDSAAPSQLRALAAAVTPAVNEVVADISPYRETRELYASEGGDARVETLLNAKAFGEVVDIVDRLALINRAVAPDLENKGLAYEALGSFADARDAYRDALKLNPESEVAKAGTIRVNDALAGKKKAAAQKKGKQN